MTLAKAHTILQRIVQAMDQAEGGGIDPPRMGRRVSCLLLPEEGTPIVGRHGLVVKFKSQFQLQTIQAVVNHCRNDPSPPRGGAGVRGRGLGRRRCVLATLEPFLLSAARSW